ncbi:hypothetical protein LCGC14_1797360 [marine sediment metagenome]|uniref:Uncharacterized protein n=1 Tax=marine sediment metagenome TaxID=412755 RepID=A0A0F9GQN1_9ZZZZ
MSKRQKAEWLARISAKTNPSKSYDEWVVHYFTQFTDAELKAEMDSYGC